MKKSIANMVQVCTEPGITPAGTGIEQVEWSILGHTYWLKSEGDPLVPHRHNDDFVSWLRD